jgi:IclR family transcriptional regulator, pca regulon regulatory protein
MAVENGLPRPRGRYFVEALGRGLAVLDCFIEQAGPHSLMDLSKRVGLGLPTTLRLVRTLEEAGYVRQDPTTRRYRLSWKMLQLQDVTQSVLDYGDVARPHLEDLAAELGEDTGMAVLDDTDIRYAIRVSASRLIHANVRPGSLFPAHATAMGKVLLATLDPAVVRELARQRPFERFTPTTITELDAFLVELRRVGAQGYALSNGEWEPGLRSLAAPVRERDGSVVAAVCVIVVRGTTPARTMEREYLPSLRRAARAISAELGYRGCAGAAQERRT